MGRGVKTILSHQSISLVINYFVIHNLKHNLFFWTETSKKPFAFRFFFNSKQMTELCETRIRNKTSSILEHRVCFKGYNKIQLFYCFISFHMRHSQNTFMNMFNINTKNDISFSIMLNKRSI